jgi:hypothetical protein
MIPPEIDRFLAINENLKFEDILNLCKSDPTLKQRICDSRVFYEALARQRLVNKRDIFKYLSNEEIISKIKEFENLPILTPSDIVNRMHAVRNSTTKYLFNNERYAKAIDRYLINSLRKYPNEQVRVSFFDFFSGSRVILSSLLNSNITPDTIINALNRGYFSGLKWKDLDKLIKYLLPQINKDPHKVLELFIHKENFNPISQNIRHRAYNAILDNLELTDKSYNEYKEQFNSL